MTLDFQRVLFAAVFASQIVVLSFYAPRRWRRHYALMFARYPPEQYPKLYAVPKAEIERKLAIFRVVYLAMGVVAILMFLAALIHSPTTHVFASFMTVAAAVQTFFPLSVAMPLGVKIWKASHAMPPPSQRSVELRPWRVTDYVPPLWIGLGLTVQTLGLACLAGYIYRPKELGVVPGALILMASGGAILAMMIYTLLSPEGYARPDPYMTGADIFRVRRRRYRIRFGGGVLMGAYQIFLVLYHAQFIHFDFAYVQLGLCISLQPWALFLASYEHLDFDTRDFSVYRVDSGTQAVP
jgi:hypothetical protein